MTLTNAERQKRWRQRRRLESDPVRRYLRSVIAWDAEHGTPASGKLAVTASKLLDAQVAGPEGSVKTFAELMGVYTPPTGRAVYTGSETSKVALTALERAQTEMDSEGGPSERSVAAGLVHCRHLLQSPAQRTTTSDDESRMAMFRATLGAGDGLAPEHLIVYRDDPADGPSAAQGDHD